MDETNGHVLLGLNLMKEVTQAADAKEGSLAVEASDYALKYAVLHLCKALAAGKLDIAMLNAVLGHWPYLRQVFKHGHGGKLVKALGEFHSTSLSPLSSVAAKCAEDALHCFKRYINDYERNPEEMESITSTAPMQSYKVGHEVGVQTIIYDWESEIFRP